MFIIYLHVCFVGKEESLSPLPVKALINILLHINAGCKKKKKKPTHHSLFVRNITTGSCPPAALIGHVFVP